MLVLDCEFHSPSGPVLVLVRQQRRTGFEPMILCDDALYRASDNANDSSTGESTVICQYHSRISTLHRW
jgi:hypothetical protein